MKPVRWGLISTARINRSLIPAIRSSRQGELIAVASRDLDKSKAYAQEWNIPIAFGSYEEIMASDQVDVVYISLPNHLHAEWAIKALRAGKHVLCEKPFALTTEEVDQMIAASRETGCALAEAFMYRHHPQTRLVGQWVHGGRLGEITLVRGMFSFALTTNRQTNVRLVPEYGGGALWDVGVYPLSYAQFIFGEAPETVSGSQWIGDTGVDETFAGQMTYSGNRIAQISCSFRNPFCTGVEIYGTEGRLVLTRPFTRLDSAERDLVFYPSEGRPQKIRIPKQETYLGEVEDMHTAILEGAPNLIRLEESRNHVRTAQALYESARDGNVVRLP